MALVAGAASADIPSDLEDLIDARASSGERALQQRGYVLTDYGHSEGMTWNYWWNASRRACVGVATANGRYDRIATVASHDCNQDTGNHESEGMSDGAKVAIGAAAILGAIALAHKSHHHSDNRHHADVDREAEFDRGFRDGQYNHSYNDYNNTQDYRDGYDEGAGARDHHSSYRHHDSGRHNRHGYTQRVGYEDLIGARASSADSELRNRGFRDVDGFKAGNTSYTIWYNRQSRQCLQMATEQGRAEIIENIGTHPTCR
jgi:hypothetical protein